MLKEVEKMGQGILFMEEMETIIGGGRTRGGRMEGWKVVKGGVGKGWGMR